MYKDKFNETIQPGYTVEVRDKYGYDYIEVLGRFKVIIEKLEYWLEDINTGRKMLLSDVIENYDEIQIVDK